MRLAIISNTSAGNGVASSYLQKVFQACEANGFTYEVFSNVLPEVHRLKEFNQLVIIGGDGTLHHVINAYKEALKDIPLSLLAAGTGNDFARSVYLKQDFDFQLDRVLNGELQPIDVGLCNEHWFLNGVGVGFDGAVVHKMLKDRWFSGHLSYYMAVLSLLFSYEETSLRITIDQQTREEKALMLTVGNGRFFGGGFLVTPQANLADGQLDACTIGRIPKWQRAFHLPKIEKGLHLSLPFVRYEQAKEIRIESTEPLHAHLDGEYHFGTDFRISLRPAYLQFRI
ncbi:YegS/Rv2252/BmrU family lipid kinase [Cytophagales bacterium LB-30]|uniref:YegS/Rv2252/BmrU family lipid kinase n=1 Tax=Shiella aurantiaca TaxID=3058365 RepID=A0ABT8F4P1_9BACT|nr:YegS/Rv2252/BmrU family lipid kinase [Shiella aurantiaca]MDN4165433.1 YegS/Rv2252/BmrU family lipid kinase [Shiella aurantiaca]